MHKTLLAVLAALVISVHGFVGTAQADLVSNADIPAGEKALLSEVYRLEIPDTSGGWNTNAIPYAVNHSATTPSGYTRVAYYLELGTADPADTRYAYAAFDVIPDLDQATELGVPSRGPNGSMKVIKASVANMRVYTNAVGATSGFYPTGGNLEFWGSNYAQGANSVFDYDDSGYGTSSGHGSMQVHNGGLAQTLIGYSAWGTVRDSELGVGTQQTGNPDWTFATGNNNLYTVQTLQVFVQVPEPASMAMIGAAGLLLLGRRRSRSVPR